MELLETLRAEKKQGRKGGIYHQTQILFAYNSNRIEGSRLSSEQTRYIFETHTFLPQSANEVIHTDDVVETLNHFRAFDYLLEVAHVPLTQDIIREFHKIIKSGTTDARDPAFAVGEYKKMPNMIGETVYTASPEDVPLQMERLLAGYAGKAADERSLIDFHYRFEKIHPFQDGNGRVGRLVLFKECLYHGLCPFIIDAEHKLFYYRGLKEYQSEPGYLIDTCLDAQDHYKALLNYFRVSVPRSALDAVCSKAVARAAEYNAASAADQYERQRTENNPERG